MMKARQIIEKKKEIDYKSWLSNVELKVSLAVTSRILSRLRDMPGQTQNAVSILDFLLFRKTYLEKILFTFDTSYATNALAVNFNGAISYIDENGGRHTEINLDVPGLLPYTLRKINSLYDHIYITFPTLDFREQSPELADVVESLIAQININNGYKPGTRPFIPLKDGRIIPIHGVINLCTIEKMDNWESFAFRIEK